MGIPYGLTNVNLNGLDLAAYDSDLDVKFGITDVDGWDGGTAATTKRSQRARHSGSTSGSRYSGARHVALKGWIRGRNPARMLPAQDALLKACSLSDVAMTVTEWGVDRWVTVSREDEPIITRKRRDYSEYSLQVGSDDWRKFGADLSGSTFLPASSGGLTVPFTVPFTIASTVVSGQVSLVNPGNEAGPVKLRIDGPCTGPVVTHVSTGQALVFSSSLVLQSGEWLDVDMEAHTILANGQASRAGWVTRRGWSAFDPGANTWTFSATEYDSASKLTVTTMPAWQ